MNKLFGIGTDIVQVARIKKIVSRYGAAFARRILSEVEYKIYQDLSTHQQIHYLAKRFAAKEAVSKALGTGISNGIAFKDISITNNSHGQPVVTYLGEAQRYVMKHHIQETFISLADEQDFAVAFVTVLQA